MHALPDEHIVADHGGSADVGVGADIAMAADSGVLADDHIRSDSRVRPDGDPPHENRGGMDLRGGIDLGASGPVLLAGNSGVVFLPLGRVPVDAGGDPVVFVVDPHRGDQSEDFLPISVGHGLLSDLGGQPFG